MFPPLPPRHTLVRIVKGSDPWTRPETTKGGRSRPSRTSVPRGLRRDGLEVAQRGQPASAWPSSCRTRSRVRSSSWPIASSVHGSPSKPNRSSRIRRSRSGSASSALRTPWRRSDSSASSNGSAASRSAKRSPSSPSSSAPTVWFSETDACARRQRLVDVLERQAGRLRELRFRRLAPELDLEPPGGPAELLLPLDDVDGHADRACVVRDRALHRLPDPPGRVGRELVAAPPVELLDRAVQAERPLLDQVEERHAQPAVALRDRHDQAQVRLDHPPLRGRVAALDRLREIDLLGRGQQLVAADVGEEELEAVGGAADRLRLVRRHGGGSGRARPPRPRASRPRARSSRARATSCSTSSSAEVVLERERLELCRLDEPALLGALDQEARLSLSSNSCN